jgi:4-amino-4-deoxy-L-arabinose transferase-like glycosyltransferase
MAWGPVGAVAAAVAVLLVATSNGYGYHRDELYFLQLGARPAWGYVDQPPATPLLARLTVAVFGDHLWALHLPGALILAGTAILTALLARELGGGRGAQVLAAASAATAFPLVFGHVLLTATLDMVLTAAVLLCLTKALLRNPRWWLATGALVGLTLYNKQLVTLTLIAIAVGLVVVGPRRVLWSGWLWAGVALAVVIGAPNIVYQITHDWPQVRMARAIERTDGAESRITFVPLQLAIMGVFLTPVWIAGIVRLFRDVSLRPVRALAVAYPVLCVLVLVTGGQPYYTAGMVLALFAAGAEPTVRWLAGRRWRRVAFGVAFAVNLVVSALIALPLLPVSALAKTPIADINQAVSDAIGWPVYVRQIADVYESLPADDRQRAAIITANYGEAGALKRFGGPYALPPVYSGQNELWYRGRPADGTDIIVAVGLPVEELSPWFGTCTKARDLDNGVDIPNEEQDNYVSVCRDPNEPWPTLWPRFQHYS